MSGSPATVFADDAGPVRRIGFSERCDLTADRAPELREQLIRAAGRDGDVLLDLSNVVFVDSSGIGAVVSLHRALAGRGDELRVAGASREASAAFELVRLHRLIEMYTSVEEGLASFGEPPA